MFLQHYKKSDMAGGIRQVLQTSANRYGHLVRNNWINCWGSTHKGRESSGKFLGLSASLIFCGFGAQIIKNTYCYYDDRTSYAQKNWPYKITQKIGTLRNELSQFNSNFSKNPFRIQKYIENGFFSTVSIPLLKYIGFLTPASCSNEGDDEICLCQSCESERKWANGNVGGKDPCDPQCNQSSGPQNRGGQSPSIKVSNNRCSSSAQCNRASDPGIDIDELSKELGGVKQMDWSMETDLSHCLLMRQATQIAVDAVTRIITEACSAYDDYHAEYRRVLDLLIDALEASRTACGADVEVIECKIILIRAKVDDVKRRIKEIDMFLGSLEKLCHAAAETAFMSHAEYASIAMSERLQSLCMEVKRLREETREKERDMLELQSLIIVESGKSLK